LDRHGEACPLGGVTCVVDTGHRGESDLIALDPAERACGPSQQTTGAVHDRVEDRLDVRLRLADDTQDVAGRGLLLQSLDDLPVRLSQRAVLLLQLGEQAHILDGDDRLIREGLEERDLHLRKWPGLGARHGDGADRSPLTEHRYDEDTAPTDHPGDCRILVLWIELDVRNVDDRAVEDGPPGDERAGRARGIDATKLRETLGADVVLGGEVDSLAIESKGCAENPVAQVHGTPDDRVEDRLHVGGRARDDLENLARGHQVAVPRLQLLEQAHILDRNDGLIREGLH